MTDSDSHTVLEIYKLHAELADRVSQRREGANRLFVTLLTGLLVFLSAVGELGGNGPNRAWFMTIVGLAGALLSVAWCVVIRSYRQLNTGKFGALHEIEKQLPYPFFQREWELLGEGGEIGTYWKLTVVEKSLPIVFVILFLAFVVLAHVR